ncbi:transporter substrate-binding domain-containing protein [bacterium]|nr:transporter substrate-binding domain-containing protein [bacterium]
MKKILLFSLLVLVCFILCGCVSFEEPESDLLQVIKSRDKVIIGVRDDAPPFGFRNEIGDLEGFDIDLARIIAKYLVGSEDDVEFVPVNAQNRMMKLESGEVDMLIATMSVTWQRWQLVEFSTPYFMAGQAIMVDKSNPAIGLKGMQDSKFIVVYGSTAEENIRKTIPDVEVIGFKTYQEAFRALKEGQGDGIFADDTILYGLAQSDDSVKILAARYSEEPYAVAVRKEGTGLLLEKINYIIENLQKSKQLEKLEQKWRINH